MLRFLRIPASFWLKKAKFLKHNLLLEFCHFKTASGLKGGGGVFKIFQILLQSHTHLPLTSTFEAYLKRVFKIPFVLCGYC
jgi:hypothetical protein